MQSSLPWCHPRSKQSGWHDAKLAKSAEPFLTRFDQVRKHYDAIDSAVRTLKDKPDDAEATARRRFSLLFQADWDNGLTRLNKAGDSPLAAVAKLELSKPSDPKDQPLSGTPGGSWPKHIPDTDPPCKRELIRGMLKPP